LAPGGPHWLASRLPPTLGGAVCAGQKSLSAVPHTHSRPFPAPATHRYVRRRAREGFKEAQAVQDSGELQHLWEQGRQQLEVVKRQAVVYSLYSRKHTHTMELAHKH
jgi:hypothetical protein